MATSVVKASPGVPRLHMYSHYRDMMSLSVPTKKPICARYQKGECNGLRCPYFHPKDLPTQPTPPKSTPTTTKQPAVPTLNPTKPPTEPTPKTPTSKPPQQPKNDRKSVSPAVVPERQGQKHSPATSRPTESQTPQDSVGSTHAPRQSRPPLLASGSQTKARTLNSDGPVIPHIKSSNGTPPPVATRPQTIVSCSVASSAIIQDNAELAPTQAIPSNPSTPGTSPSHKNKNRQKKVRYIHHLGCSDPLTR
ncbi:hypothetical protein BDM02DRAFT_3139629 [Thelephora ganbajun]|uniref:Uncharacterized protein n=1 Tax=Thelephora ganbajun TaxID=370292 RepID=A0ACB6ZP02_THEGA|nr:hypothetical protein BDM02DRAFT_3139629 [Thelephora ganbajun]